MPSDEYNAAIGGGLKLKGGKPAGVTKKKKKKKEKSHEDRETSNDPKAKALEDALSGKEKELAVAKKSETAGWEDGMERDEISREEQHDDGYSYGDGKTEAERKHEEMRRKRLNERLKKEGAKPHKQRVEEFNKYLSNLSEHHDMPRIGPG